MSRFFAAAAMTAGTAALIVGLTAASATPESSVQPVLAETFFKCASGYSFAVNGGDSAQCKRAAYTSTATKQLADCPNVGGVGTFARADFNRTTDMCVGTNPVTGQVAVERACVLIDVAAGYTKRIVSGTDRCEKSTYHPTDIKAPSVAVTR